MALVIHLAVAFLGIINSTVAVFSPSRFKIRLASFFVACTIASGFYLVWTTKTAILQACLAGLAYIGFNGAALILARFRLAADKQ